MKFALITITSVAVVLGLITYFALFSGPQIIQPNSASHTPPIVQSSTPTSSAFIDPQTGGAATSSGATSSGTPLYQTTFTAPYPITWTAGQPQFAITAAALQNNQLTLSVNIQMGETAQCVPVNLRLIIDELGTMQAPSSPSGANFPLAPDGTCQGDPQTSYSENVTFTVNPAAMPLLLSTGDSANGFIEISTSTGNRLQVTVPQKNG